MFKSSSIGTSVHHGHQETRHQEAHRDHAKTNHSQHENWYQDGESRQRFDTAIRLLSETAHDVRAPLTGIREAIRVVHDGDLGEISEIQREMLADAIGQCDSVDSLVSNMLHLDRLQSGLPSVLRDWIRPAQLLLSSDSMIQSIAAVRRVDVIWQGFDGGMDPLFGDVELLRRLVLNLVCNAITVSQERSHVFVSLRRSVHRGFARIMVTDQGPGMTDDAISKLVRRGESGTGGTGLGLTIGRALAGLHFGRLIISSQPGKGTKIGIEVPAGGPTSVADAFSRWRIAVAPTRGHINKLADMNESASAVSDINDHEFRVDAPERLANGTYKDELLLPFEGASPRFPQAVIAGGLRLENEVSGADADAIDGMLQMNQRMHELVYRTNARRWVMLWDASQEEAKRRATDLDLSIRSATGVEGLVWTQPISHSVVDRGDRSQIREVLVRDTLHASARSPMFEDRYSRRIGQAESEAIDQEGESSQDKRLDEELRRLNKVLKRQSERLQHQASHYDRIGDGH